MSTGEICVKVNAIISPKLQRLLELSKETAELIESLQPDDIAAVCVEETKRTPPPDPPREHIP